MRTTIAVTPGEPSGIGPDICLRYFAALLEERRLDSLPSLVFVADPDLLADRASDLGLTVDFEEYRLGNPARAEAMRVLPVPLANACRSVQLDAANAPYVLNTLRRAAQGCLDKEFQALVTGPVQKSIINEAGIPFSGHTEFLAELCARDTVVMMLATDELRVALVTTHLPLAQVPAAITPQRLERVIGILNQDLIEKFGCEKPRILVTGLNPHAGEGGHLGREEIDIIEPVLETLRVRGMNLVGPLPADTLFTPKYLRDADAVLAMYHDQGLPILKYQGFGRAINVTLGLPIIRTSVDHGTALDLAGTGKADYGSLGAAVRTAALMCDQRTMA